MYRSLMLSILLFLDQNSLQVSSRLGRIRTFLSLSNQSCQTQYLILFPFLNCRSFAMVSLIYLVSFSETLLKDRIKVLNSFSWVGLSSFSHIEFNIMARMMQYQQNQNSDSSIGISHALIENLRTGLNIFLGEIVRLVRENLRNRLGDFVGEAFLGLLLLSRRKMAGLASLSCMLASLYEREGCLCCGSAALLILIEGTYVLAMSEETFSTESFLTRCDLQVTSQVSAFLLRFSRKKGRSYIFSQIALSPQSEFPCPFLSPYSSLMAIRGKSEKLDSESMVAVLSFLLCCKKSKESSIGLRLKTERLLL